MAKALHGYLVAPDAREQARLLAENRRLQQRVRDLETQLLLALEARDRAETAVTSRSGLAPV